MLVRSLMTVGLALLVPQAMQAQPIPRPARIGGVVYDSTSNAPLTKATVDAVVASDPARIWSTTTDERGDFAFDSLPAGTYIVAVSHPRLDSLGVRQLSLGSTVGAGQRARVRLTVPSAPSLIRRVCGDSLAADRSGYVRGVLRHADRSAFGVSGRVQLQWMEVAITKEGIGRQIITIESRADDEGRFTACGVPAEGLLQLRASHETDSTGVVELEVPFNGILVRDLYVGRSRTVALAIRDSSAAATQESPGDTAAVNVQVRRGDGVLRGTTRSTNDTPLPDVRVSLWGTGMEVRSGADGRFALAELPTGSNTIDVRAIGYVPVRQVVDILPGDRNALSIALDRRARLDTVRIMATRDDLMNRRLAEFENSRKTRGTGRFITPEAIEKHPPLRTADLFRTIPGVRVIPAAGGDQVVMRGQSFSQWCTPELWVDGVRVVNSVGLDVIVNAQDVLAVEVYNSGAAVPAQLAGFSGCGAIVLYTGMRERARR